MAYPFYTVGHSTRSIGDFIELLVAAQVGLVVDVRAFPRSRTNPDYDREALPQSLSQFRISYEHVAELGGRRPRQRDIDPGVNGFWKNQSFHNYADYAMGGGFRSSLAGLRARGNLQPCVLMCAEAMWWRCHRRIIADYLLVAGEHVFHILGPGKIVPGTLTPAAKPGPGSTLTYPAPQPEERP
jgi:uncharacterized protein (DUF488 family)